jgi:hypothetical protein
MPATVSVNYFDHPEFEDILRRQLEEFMSRYEGRWTIRLSGSQQNAIWELKVEAPNGTRESVTTLYGEDGAQPIDKLLVELRKLVKRISE